MVVSAIKHVGSDRLVDLFSGGSLITTQFVDNPSNSNDVEINCRSESNNDSTWHYFMMSLFKLWTTSYVSVFGLTLMKYSFVFELLGVHYSVVITNVRATSISTPQSNCEWNVKGSLCCLWNYSYRCQFRNAL